MTKMLEVFCCQQGDVFFGGFRCPHFKKNGFTSYRAYCAEMSPDKLIDIDYHKHIPAWCPLKDKPENAVTKSSREAMLRAEQLRFGR
jgi:hypothetical protein